MIEHAGRIGLVLAACLVCGAAAAAPSVKEELIDVGPIKLARVTLPADTDAGPPVRYYLAPAHVRAPLVLYIQGSGCVPPFVNLDTPYRYSTIFGWLPLANQQRYAVMAVDKPYQSNQKQQGEPGTAVGCADAFNQHFSYDTWLATLTRAVRHALARPDVDPRRVLVIGMSEGAVMAAGLAQALPEVTDVVLMGTNGPTQLFDFAANIYRSADSDDAKRQQLQQLDDTFTAISADPQSTSKFVWGHTYLRWSSFFAQSPADNLAHAKARVYLASGMQDRNVPILSTEVMYAQLRAQGRDVTFHRVPMAGHNLAPEGRPITDAQADYDAFFAWFEHR